jgi:hypothetical protein
MTIAKSPAPQSKASVALVKVDTPIKEVDTLIGQVRPPIQQLLVQVTSLDTKYLTPGIKLCNDIVSVCNGILRENVGDSYYWKYSWANCIGHRQNEHRRQCEKDRWRGVASFGEGIVPQIACNVIMRTNYLDQT